jgi:hypothetical protein
MQCFYLTVVAHHVPILGVLKPGVVSVFESDGNTKRYFGKEKFLFVSEERHRLEQSDPLLLVFLVFLILIIKKIIFQ